jgi:hypothetical protein
VLCAEHRREKHMILLANRLRRWFLVALHALVGHSQSHSAPDNGCPYCGANLAFYRVLGRSHKGRVASAEKGWRCGTNTRMELFIDVEFVRGEQCGSNLPQCLNSKTPEK